MKCLLAILCSSVCLSWAQYNNNPNTFGASSTIPGDNFRQNIGRQHSQVQEQNTLINDDNRYRQSSGNESSTRSDGGRVLHYSGGSQQIGYGAQPSGTYLPAAKDYTYQAPNHLDGHDNFGSSRNQYQNRENIYRPVTVPSNILNPHQQTSDIQSNSIYTNQQSAGYQSNSAYPTNQYSGNPSNDINSYRQTQEYSSNNIYSRDGSPQYSQQSRHDQSSPQLRTNIQQSGNSQHSLNQQPAFSRFDQQRINSQVLSNTRQPNSHNQYSPQHPISSNNYNQKNTNSFSNDAFNREKQQLHYNSNSRNVHYQQQSEYDSGFGDNRGQNNYRGLNSPSSSGRANHAFHQTYYQPQESHFNGSDNLAAYEFGYGVAVEETGAEFEHEEARTGDLAKGKYRVLLPDGRRQLVEYEADGAGFRPKISYEGRAFVDPLTPQNVNTVVTDLLNTELKRTRNQEGWQQAFGRQGDRSIGYVSTENAQSQNFDSRNPDYGRGLSSAFNHEHPPNPQRELPLSRTNPGKEGRRGSSSFLNQQPNSFPPQLQSTTASYQRSLESSAGFNGLPHSGKHLTAGSYQSSFGGSSNSNTNRHFQTGNQYTTEAYRSTSNPSINSNSQQFTTESYLRSFGTSVHQTTPTARGIAAFRAQNNEPRTISSTLQLGDENQYSLLEGKSLSSSSGLQNSSFNYNTGPFAHSPGILYSQSYAKNLHQLPTSSGHNHHSQSSQNEPSSQSGYETKNTPAIPTRTY